MEQSRDPGRHVSGVLSSADASAGAEITLFDVGNDDAAYTLGADEHLVVESVQVTSAAGGDVAVFLDTDDDNAIDAAETVLRGTIAANGTLTATFSGPFFRRGQNGAKPHAIAPAGDLSVTLNGFVRKAVTRQDAIGA